MSLPWCLWRLSCFYMVLECFRCQNNLTVACDVNWIEVFEAFTLILVELKWSLLWFWDSSFSSFFMFLADHGFKGCFWVFQEFCRRPSLTSIWVFSFKSLEDWVSYNNRRLIIILPMWCRWLRFTSWKLSYNFLVGFLFKFVSSFLEKLIFILVFSFKFFDIFIFSEELMSEFNKLWLVVRDGTRATQFVFEDEILTFKFVYAILHFLHFLDEVLLNLMSLILEFFNTSMQLL